MTDERPSVDITTFPDEILLQEPGDLTPKKVYARVDFPPDKEEDYGTFQLFVRVRPLSGMQKEMFTDNTKGDIHHPQLDDPELNYRMDLVESWAPLKGGRPVPGPGWFEILDLEQADVRDDVEVEVILFRKTGRRMWCAEKQITVRQCSHPARLVQRFPIVDSRGLMAIGDLTGDGQLDFLVTVGALRQTAYRFDGEILWDHEDLDADRIRPGNCLVPIYDIDGDGHNEVVAVRRDADQYYLCILDGRTGMIKRRIPLPEVIRAYDDPPMCNIQIANLRGLDRPSDIVFSHHYSDITVLDEELNVIWRRDMWADEGATVVCPPARPGAEARFPYGFAHTPAFADLDGDGHDEIVAGATLIDHDGTFLWNRKDLPRINADHNDSVCIADLEQNGTHSILLSTGLWCLDAKGDVRWGFGRTVCHGQQVRAARVIPGSPNLQIILVDWRCYVGLEPPHTVYLLDADGTVFWHRVTGWAAPLHWSGRDYQDIWLGPEEMTGIGEIVNHEGAFLGYLPGGVHRRALSTPDRGGDLWATTVEREGNGYLEVYESVDTPASEPESGISRTCRTDDWQYSLY